MTEIAEEFFDIGAGRLRALTGGTGREPTIFLHGGIPGVTPYCSGAHLWSSCLPLFARDRQVIALDLPGSGGSPVGKEPYRIDTIGRAVLALAEAKRLGPVHLVGSDQGGLVALWLALEAPQIVRSATLVSGPTATATGDGLENLTLAYPPLPLWSRASQAWALDRLSYAHQHIDDALLNGCEAAAAGTPHKEAVKRAAEGSLQTFMASAGAAKTRLYQACRDAGVTRPVQLVWATHDPLTTRNHGMTLYQLIAQKQRATQFHLLNRTGALPFREEPAEFHHMVAAFQDGVAPTN